MNKVINWMRSFAIVGILISTILACLVIYHVIAITGYVVLAVAILFIFGVISMNSLYEVWLAFKLKLSVWWAALRARFGTKTSL